MSKFVRNVALFLASISLLVNKSGAAADGPLDGAIPPPDDEAVPLRPLNMPGENLFAGHRSHSSHVSHSSHASHSSHYSGAGGGYAPAPAPAPVPPQYIAPSPPAPSPPPSPTPSPSYLTPNYGEGSGPSAAKPRLDAPAPEAPVPAPTLSLDEKRRLQIMRVQLQLVRLGLYAGKVDGALNPDTRAAIEHFQTLKGLPATGTMTTPTLNALGVPAAY